MPPTAPTDQGSRNHEEFPRPKWPVSMDLRGLALFRVVLALGFLATCWSINQPPEAGTLELAADLPPGLWLPVSPLPPATIGFGIVAALAFLGLLFGYHTRLAGLVAWALTALPFTGGVGSMWWSQMLLWSALLPSDAFASVEASRRERAGDGSIQPAGRDITTAGVPPVAYAVHWAVFCAWASYLGPVASPVAGTIVLAGLVLLAVPPLLRWARPLAFGVILTGCAAILLTGHLGAGLAFLTASLPYSPQRWWSKLSERSHTGARTGLRIYYDGECGFCRRMVYLLRSLLLLPDTPIRPAQEDPRTAELLERYYSWVLIDAEGNATIRFEAFVVLLEHSPYVGWLVRPLPLRRLRPLGDRAYNFVAHHRTGFGRVSKHLLSQRPPREGAGSLEKAFAVFLALLVVFQALRLL